MTYALHMMHYTFIMTVDLANVNGTQAPTSRDPFLLAFGVCPISEVARL
jgi:hypothetical protein